MKFLSNIKMDQPATSQPSASLTPGTSDATTNIMNALPMLLGTAGSVGGVVSGGYPGSIAGGFLGGMTGKNIGNVVQELRGKKKVPSGLAGSAQNIKESLLSGGEQAAFGAIPGGEELKGIPIAGKLASNILGRTALRAGTGYLGGGFAQELSNKQQPQQQSPVTSGLATGAINALIPGLGEALNVPLSGIRGLGNITQKSSERILERRSIPEFNAIQRLFGKEAINTASGKTTISPEVDRIIKEYKIPIAPQGDIGGFKPSIDAASQQVENKLQPILQDPKYAIKNSEVQNIIYTNLGQFFGKMSGRASSSLPVAIDKLLTKGIDKSGNINLSTLKAVQREIGPVGGTDWSQPASTPLEKWARKTYTDIGQIYDRQLNAVDNAAYKDLINQHKILLKARDNYSTVMKTGGILPAELTSTEHAKEQMGSGLSHSRAIDLGLRMSPLALGPVAQLTGLPKQVKDLALIASALYGGAEFGPNINPEKALQIGGKMANIPAVNTQAIKAALQQLGVRIPVSLQ